MSSRCGTCGQPHDAWMTIEKTVAVMCERAENPRRRAADRRLKFMVRLAKEGGRIVGWECRLVPKECSCALPPSADQSELRQAPGDKLK